jgi:tRNA G10  N-methylase Trm11
MQQDTKKMEELLDKVMTYVEQRGFPFYEFDYEKKLKEFNRAAIIDLQNLWENNELKQRIEGLGLCWSYFPHAWEIKIAGQRTPKEIWDDKEMLRKAIAHRLRRGGLPMLFDECKMTDSQIRKALKSYTGTQAVSNFRPTAAAAMYKKYGGGNVWDMSCGFGGRLIGAYLAGNIKHYFGTDPSTKTMQGLLNIKDDFKHLPMNVSLYEMGSEDFNPPVELDMCFTSPPYFDREQYADEESQSFKRHANVEAWNEGFLRKTIRNCWQGLKMGKILALNVANVKRHMSLEKDTVHIATSEKFELIDVVKMRLSSIQRGGYKFEPIFIFKKVAYQPRQLWLPI